MAGYTSGPATFARHGLAIELDQGSCVPVGSFGVSPSVHIRHAHRYGLAQILSRGTAGRFCHHLRERQTAGLVVHRLRNGYAVPAGW
jgi:hypothetical protein